MDWSSKEEARTPSAGWEFTSFNLVIEEVGVDWSRVYLRQDPRVKLLGKTNIWD